MANSKNQKLIDEFQEINWGITCLCLKDTCHELDAFIKERLQKEINGWPVKLRYNILKFSNRANEIQDYVKYEKSGWTIACPADETHPQIMEKILSLSSNRKYKHMQWASNSDETTDLYWIIGKIYMPYGNRSSKSPSDADAISKIDLLKNCRLFSEDFDQELLENLQEVRNTLTHGNQKLTTMEKEKYITLMEKLLETPCLPCTCTSKDLKRSLSRLKSKNVQLIPIELDMMEHFLPRKSREELLQISKQAVDDCVNYALKNLEKTSGKLQEHLKKELEENEFNEKVGGGIGAAVMAGAGVATGAAAGAVGSIVIGAGVVATAPVVIPAVAVGAIGLGIGWIAGKAGGRVVSMFKKITD